MIIVAKPHHRDVRGGQPSLWSSHDHQASSSGRAGRLPIISSIISMIIFVKHHHRDVREGHPSLSSIIIGVCRSVIHHHQHHQHHQAASLKRAGGQPSSSSIIIGRCRGVSHDRQASSSGRVEGPPPPSGSPRPGDAPPRFL